MLRLLLFLLLLWAGYYFWQHPEDISHPENFITYSIVRAESIADIPPFVSSFGEQKQPPGVLVPTVPSIFPVKVAAWVSGDYTFTAMDGYRLRARVLGKLHYTMGRETDLSPYDLVLGWEGMSDTRTLDAMSITQGNRWFHADYTGTPLLPPQQVMLQAGNMHMIPGNDAVLEKLRRVVKGNVIDLAGYLVDVRGKDGWTWDSGTGPVSEGPHGCKVIWVTDLNIE